MPVVIASDLCDAEEVAPVVQPETGGSEILELIPNRRHRVAFPK